MNSKRITALVAALALCLIAAIPAFAATSYDIAKSVLMDTTVTFAEGSFDKAGKELTAMTITSLPDSSTVGSLKLSGADVDEEDVIARANFENLTFVPVASYTGNAVITWEGDYEGTAATGVTATITFQVLPTAHNQTIYVSKNTTKQGYLDIRNPAGIPVTISQNVTNPLTPAKGDVTLSSTTGYFTYKPDTDVVGDDSFSYTISFEGRTDTATVTVKIGEVEAPTAYNQTISVTKGIATSSSMHATDPNPVASVTALRYRVTRQPTKGTVNASEDGSFTYTHSGDKLGTDSFDFVANNGYKDSNTATVTIDINLPMLTYEDLKDHWANTSAGSLGGINKVVGDKIHDLYYYRPGEIMTRAEYVLLLNSIMNYTASTRATSYFADVTERHLIVPVNTAYEQGVTAGTLFNGKVYFYPGKAVTRIEAMRMLDNAMKFSPQNTTPVLEFSDRGQIPSWAEQSVRNLIGYKIVTGSAGRLRPLDNLTRAEAAEMLFKAYVEMNK